MIPLGNLTGLSSHLDGIAALMKNAPAGIMGASAISPPKQLPETSFGDPMTFGMPEKQIPGTDYADQFAGAGPTKQLPQQLGAAFAAPTDFPTLSGPGTGAIGSLGGNLAHLDQFDSAFARAAGQYGFDANWLKAMAAEEGGWGSVATSGAGAIGLMQIVPGGYPGLEAMYPGWRTDPAQNIMLGAAILQQKVQENGGDLNLGTQRYLGRGTDPWTGISTDQYLSQITTYYNQLRSSGGSFGGGSGGGWATAFGSATVPGWGEFNAPSSNGLYGYGTQYGLNGTNHTGLDIPMVYGTAYRAPASGTVMCAGTGVGQGSDGGGCAAFSDMIGGGAGRVEVLLDNGAVLIFGHSASSALRPGQHFNAGQVLGTSGGENSPHIHLEARVRDSSMPSGWRIVDPRTVLGGGPGAINIAYQQRASGGGYGSIASQIHAFLSGAR